MEFMDFILKESLILIPVLLIFGEFLKSTTIINDKFIPILILALGILFSLALNGCSVENIIQGVLVSGAAVFSNQIYKQIMYK